MTNGKLWRIVRVHPNDTRLIDRTGTVRIATTDPQTRSVYIAWDIPPPLLDKVLMHEISHAITVSYGLLKPLRQSVPQDAWITVEEWASQLVENYSIEAAALASESLGRPVCIRGYCYG